MPHYKDGSLANVGDVLKTPEGKIGTVADISAGGGGVDAQVAVVRVSTPETALWNDAARVISNGGVVKLAVIDVLCVTLGECEKVA